MNWASKGLSFKCNYKHFFEPNFADPISPLSALKLSDCTTSVNSQISLTSSTTTTNNPRGQAGRQAGRRLASWE